MRTGAVVFMLLALCAVVYGPTVQSDFVDLDDRFNIIENPRLKDGLTPGNIAWAMTTDFGDYWHPMMWITLLIDVEVWGGLDPRGFHLSNVIFHAIASVLAFAALRSITGSFWLSALVAGWFALHPTRVESVAWITERKDVLSGVFWWGTVWAYSAYAQRGGWQRYLALLVVFALGLMSKPMLVTLPCVLLLLDVWPLRRLRFDGREGASVEPGPQFTLGAAARLVIEKLSLFVMAAGSAILTFIHGSKAIAEISLRLRVENAMVSYVRYIGKMFWPDDLVVYYPYPGLFGEPRWELWQTGGAAAVLTIITAASLITLRARPYLFVGWFWYLGTLAPVIGVIQVGNQAMADRFAYLPYAGLFIMLAWGARDMIIWGPSLRRPLAALAVTSLVACMVLSMKQVQVWRNTDTLYQHALSHSQHNWMIHEAYGTYLFLHKRYDEAARQMERAIALHPDYPRTRYLYGLTLGHLGRRFEAVEQLEAALRLNDRDAAVHYALGVLLALRGDTARAIQHVEQAIELDPSKSAEYRQTLEEIRLRSSSQVPESDNEPRTTTPNERRVQAPMYLA